MSQILYQILGSQILGSHRFWGQVFRYHMLLKDLTPSPRDPKSADEDAYRNALFQLVMAHGVMSSVSAGSGAVIPGEHPCAHALARLQARSPAWVVSGMRHVAMDLDAPARQLLDLLDGSRTINQLKTLMQAALAQAGLEKPHETISKLTHQQLWLFARQGLLTQ